jgi:hypothetical protein
VSFDDDSGNERPAPQPREPKDSGGSSKQMNEMIMLVVLLGAFFLFKDEIMGLINGLPGLGQTATETTAAPETEAAEPAKPAEAEAEAGDGGGGGKKKGRSGGKRGGGGKAGGGGKRGGKRGGRDEENAETGGEEEESGGGESYYTFANVNYY